MRTTYKGDNNEALAALRLIRSERVGPILYRRLLERFGSAAAALDALPRLARHGGRTRPITVCTAEAADAERTALAELGGRLLVLGTPDYPPALAAIEDAPPVLAALGRLELLDGNAVALVGARNASANGRRLAGQLAAGLGEAGFVVVSGLARGIDAAAHQGALASGTVAVLAGGLDVVYPPEHQGLYEAIAAQGLLLSEVPLGTTPQASHFPRRNRLISGLSLGVVVVEAAPRSGSLITARLALEQGREVFAVPGSPLDPRARGCNDLLRQGAVLTESAEDVLRGLDGMARPQRAARTPGLQAAETAEFKEISTSLPSECELEGARPQVEALLGYDPVAVDEVIRQCQLSPAVVHMVLLELELAGRAERHPGNRIALAV
ncbi:MAG: DNA-processing protein DprA [Kiloniellales bacterium]